MPTLLRLDENSCRTLLRVNVVGRIAFVHEGTPRIAPVNYTMDGPDVVMAVDPTSELGRVVAASDRSEPPVAVFEIDHVDQDRHQGWSVTVTGPLSRAEHAGSKPRPWADGVRAMLVRVSAFRVSGVRLGTDWGRTHDAPVLRQA